MQLACRYQEGVQLELLGDPSSLDVLGTSLQTRDSAVAVDLLTIPEATWDGSLHKLVTQTTSGPVSIQHDGETVTISGGAEQLSLLGRNIAWFAEHTDTTDASDHIHLEHLRDTTTTSRPTRSPLIVRLFDRSP